MIAWHFISTISKTAKVILKYHDEGKSIYQFAVAGGMILFAQIVMPNWQITPYALSESEPCYLTLNYSVFHRQPILS